LNLNNPESLFHSDMDRLLAKEAIEYWRTQLQSGSTPEGHMNLGLALMNDRQFEKGVAHLREAARRSPGRHDLQVLVSALETRLKAELEREARHAAELERNRRTVMTVDDSPTVRKLVTMTLERAGYRVRAAASAQDAAEMIRMHGLPDLLLLDINMPGMDGFQFCKSLRGTELTAQVPIIMLTGKDGFFSKLRGQMSGATEYLTKPFQPEDLTRIVAKYCPVTTGTQPVRASAV
jgi:twitching motility two-component system response regulator PilG